MWLDGEHAGAGRDEMARQRTSAGSDVEDELAGMDSRVSYDSRGPVVREWVPPPGAP
jgi:hypothetical protein